MAGLWVGLEQLSVLIDFVTSGILRKTSIIWNKVNGFHCKKEAGTRTFKCDRGDYFGIKN
jgi:hypothetical protein